MSWPQIGGYTENGITVRVFQPGYARGDESIFACPVTKAKFHRRFRFIKGKRVCLKKDDSDLPEKELDFN